MVINKQGNIREICLLLFVALSAASAALKDATNSYLMIFPNLFQNLFTRYIIENFKILYRLGNDSEKQFNALFLQQLSATKKWDD
ncbi:MAG: hypothetical protein QXL10_00515 [Candidatus Bathyarchaeia archaeon]